jgi:outer membrane protein OmpA-like peptidoglycan-associated protein
MHVLAVKPKPSGSARPRAASRSGELATRRHLGSPAYLRHRVHDPGGSANHHACSCGSSACSTCAGTAQTQDHLADSSARPSPVRQRSPTLSRGRRSGAAPYVPDTGVWPLHVVLDKFEFDKSRLTPELWNKLEKLSSFLRVLPPGAVDLMAIGHTDSTGTETYNAGLSERRADTVADAIGLRLGLAVTRTGHGKNEPVADNATEPGRGRNRRVDVQLRPGRLNWTFQPTPVPTPTPIPEPDRPQPEPFFCLRSPLHFAICAAAVASTGAALMEGLGLLAGLIGGLLGGVGGLLKQIRRVVNCLLHPMECVFGPDDDDGPEPKDKDKKPPPDHACVASSALPSGPYPPKLLSDGNSWRFGAPLTVELTFSNDRKKGCAAYCGEYQQEVHGTFDYHDGTSWRLLPPKMLATKPLHSTEFREDAGITPDGDFRPQGHRYKDYWGGELWKNIPTDRFDNPNRKSGRKYYGSDVPGRRWKQLPTSGMFRFNLQFRGAAVDGCFGRTPVGDWSKWSVVGSIQFGPGGTGPAGPTGPAAPTGPAKPTGPQLATPLPAGLAIEIEKQWLADPLSLCLDDQISCGAATYADELRRRGTPLTGIERNTALARELAALNVHCDLLHKATMESFRQSLDDLAARRLDNFLHWGEQVGDHAIDAPCPSE